MEWIKSTKCRNRKLWFKELQRNSDNDYVENVNKGFPNSATTGENSKISQLELKMIESMNFTQQVAILYMAYKTKIIYGKIIFIYICNYEAPPDHLYITQGPKVIF